MRIALAALLFTACAESRPPEPAEAHGASALERICADAPCLGRIARLHAWRDARGEIVLYVYDGDGIECSHPPRVYYGADGAVRAGVAFEPVVAGSEQDRALTAQREELLRGLTEAEALTCPQR